MVEIKITVHTDLDLEKVEKGITEAAEKGLRQLTQQAYEEWQNIAARRLKTTRRRYQDSLSFTMKDANTGVISLHAKDKDSEWLINALENGVEPYSIREAVLAKAKKHWPRDMSPQQRRAMFAYLARVGRLGKPPVPFTDVPLRTGGSKEQGKPNAFRRISPNTKPDGWQHPGFKPKGGGGPGPLREEVIEYVKKTAGDVFASLLARVLV
jgi:hypothetical protein